jgi:hypothetical protein
LGDVFFRAVDVRVCAEPAPAAARLLRAAVPFFQQVHKVQHFLLLVRGPIAEFFKNLWFDGRKSLSGNL